MKKILAMAFIAALATSCAKKETATESNVMLAEPTVTTVDSAAAKPTDQTTVAPVADTAAVVKTDSAAVSK